MEETTHRQQGHLTGNSKLKQMQSPQYIQSTGLRQWVEMTRVINSDGGKARNEGKREVSQTETY